MLMNADHQVTATFTATPPGTFQITLVRKGTGSASRRGSAAPRTWL
jgi:hypothetical protein